MWYNCCMGNMTENGIDGINNVKTTEEMVTDDNGRWCGRDEIDHGGVKQET